MARIARVLALLAFLAGVPAQAGIETNGSFEDPDIPSGTFQIFAVGIPGWTTSSGPGIELQDNAAGSPFDGDQHVELDSAGNSGMLQTLTTVVGQSYTLSFAYSPRPGVAADSNGIGVSWDGNLLANITEDGTGMTDTDWTVFTFPVVATASETDLAFVATGISNSLGGYLDDVRVDPIPEPSAFVLWLVFTAFGVTASRWRK